jgi:hypothetical protein
MKPQETTPLLTALAPAALLTPPVAIVGVLLAVGLLWLFSERDAPEKSAAEAEAPSPDLPPVEQPKAEAPRVSKRTVASRRVTREDLAAALEYGAKPFTRKEAVAALEALGFRKTSAYKALQRGGNFDTFLDFTPDGLIEWSG